MATSEHTTAVPRNGARTSTLDVDEVDVVRGRVDHGPERHLVGDLPVEPDVLVGREQPGELRPNDADDVPEHGHEDHAAVERKHETRATGGPHGPLEAVQAGEEVVRGLQRSCLVRNRIVGRSKVPYLRVPPVPEDEQMDTVPDNVEGEAPRVEDLALEERLAHSVQDEGEGERLD
jgi:hypothetical protein